MIANVFVNSEAHVVTLARSTYETWFTFFSPILFPRNEQIVVQLQIALSGGGCAPRNREDVRAEQAKGRAR